MHDFVHTQMVCVPTVIYTRNECSSKCAGSLTLSVLITQTEIILAIHSHTPAVRCCGMPFSVHVRMHTHSLVSKPRLLEMRLALTFELSHYDVLIDTM